MNVWKNDGPDLNDNECYLADLGYYTLLWLGISLSYFFFFSFFLGSFFSFLFFEIVFFYYSGVITPYKTPPHGELSEYQLAFNRVLQ